VFSVWNEKNECLSWEETVEWASLLGLEMAPVLYKGIWNEKVIRQLQKPTDLWGNDTEGYVVRAAESFTFREFRKQMAKYVRADHKRTHDFWRHQQVVPNKLANS
jgi:hypothetical protein